MKKIRLSPAATFVENSNGVLLQSDLGDFQLHGQDVSDFIRHIYPLLKGDYSAQDICEKLPQYADSSIHSLLSLLEKNALVEEISDAELFSPPWLPHERFLRVWSSPEKCSSHDLKEQHILVIGLEPWAITMVEELANTGVGHIHLVDNDVLTNEDILCNRFLSQQDLGKSRAEALRAALCERINWCNITYETLCLDKQQAFTLEYSSKWDLAVVALSKSAQFWLQKTAYYIHEQGIQTLYGNLDGLESWVGPVVKTDETPCWNCMRLRRLGTAANPQIAHELDKVAVTKQAGRARTMLSSMSTLTGQQMAMEVLKLMLNYTPSKLAGKVSVKNLITDETHLHTIIPVPWCEICHHDKSKLNDQPIHNHPENPLNNVTSIEQLKTLLEGWIDPVTGIIRQLSGHSPHLPDFPVTASAGVATFSAGHFDPRAMGHVGSGKGLDEISAHISAVGEAIERYSAARFRKSACKYAAIKQLTGEFVDPDDLVLYSPSQYQSMNFPFSKWRKNQKIHWTQGSWIGTQRSVWVPALVSYFNFECPHEEQFSQVSSNGLAAGQSHEDAAIRATYELIERDAMMLTWYAQLPCQRLSIETQYQGKMRLLIDDIVSQGIELELYLLDVGIHVPTVVCLALGDGMRSPAVSVALATHGDIHVAMRKALLEQGHVMPYLCHLMRSGHKLPRHVHEVQSLEDHAAYYFSSDKKSAFDFMRQPLEQAIEPAQWDFPVVANIDDLRQRLLAAKVDVAIVDVTSPDVALSPFKVARAVGVNMQPIHFGEQFKRVNNPRLRQLLKGQAVNANPHPIA
ncbi:molybdopterin biosynthesis protein MoeB [Marinomonas spartinae]|uniref:Molybdopterin biosynthesis protein MoeB n=1 Tax=Marinomonas spartinae TaxID=1792290 RepID=A0A1A8T381_9GAMM|nr:TOMM precursor leader peptide-binding protein [Marinomonas spartinae]SBS25205.1 molybdopterin biosynthesis protein MoeB [Marinomonas spartinae]